jgi:hypothetical protein
MSLLTPTRIPVCFALARDRVTPNPETEKHSFHRFHSIPDLGSLWLLAAKFGPAMLTKSPTVLEAEKLGSAAARCNCLTMRRSHLIHPFRSFANSACFENWLSSKSRS